MSEHWFPDLDGVWHKQYRWNNAVCGAIANPKSMWLTSAPSNGTVCADCED